MDISDELIDRLSELAKLEFKGEEREKIREDMQKMLAFVEKLNELDTDHVEPLIFMSDEENVLREDKIITSITHEEALLNAPKKDSDFFRVPKFLEK